MVSIKQATANATNFARDLFGEDSLRRIRLEEVDSNDRSWFITLSMISGDDPIAVAVGTALPVYKVFTVDKETGEVTAMRIRELANA